MTHGVQDEFLASLVPLLKIQSRRDHVFNARRTKTLRGSVDACFGHLFPFKCPGSHAMVLKCVQLDTGVASKRSDELY